MLILLRQQPDERLQKVISSLVLKEPSSRLVYLEHSLEGIAQDTEPFILSGVTSSLDLPPRSSIEKIEPKGLLHLIRETPRILVLP
ncbi:MAG: hypothetical protein VST70_02690 [Nitrospirota bacterium]|nr:hypothetical protein [Nitrospirota bacterium]